MAQIDKPTEYFNTVLYAGNSSTQSITGVNFQPDFVWTKGRSQIRNNTLYDSVRGVQNQLYSNQTAAELNVADSLTSFDSDGFSLGSNSQSNWSSSTYVAWNWLAGGTASSNTDGSITSQVSANTTSGFSIVSWTGNGTQDATVGHGLGTTPAMIIVKNRDDTANWRVWHQGLSGSTYFLGLNQTAAESDSSTVFNGTSSTTFTIGNDPAVNDNTEDIIAYCFAEKKGFSKFGSYTGNGSTDGTFVYTGFKPAFVIAKTNTNIDNWRMYDNKRLGFNPNNSVLSPNLSEAETASTNHIDILSNGFKWRSDNNNASSVGYIYMAFAENPLVGTNNIPATAR